MWLCCIPRPFKQLCLTSANIAEFTHYECDPLSVKYRVCNIYSIKRAIHTHISQVLGSTYLLHPALILQSIIELVQKGLVKVYDNND